MSDPIDVRRGRITSFGQFCLHPNERRLEREGIPLVVGSRALDILIALVERAGQTVTKKELFSCVWPHVNVEESSLRVHIAGLRKALCDGKDGARYITNVPGRGYCFVAPVACRNATPGDPSPMAATKRSAPVQTLPGRIKGLVGRDRVIQTLVAELSVHRFLTIIGPPGVGKTVVALSVADEWAARCSGRVCYVDLANDDGIDTVYDAIAERLGIDSTGVDGVAGLISFLDDEASLIVLDNCESLLDQVAALAEELMARLSQVTVLVSSREALRAHGERVRQLPALDCPRAADAADEGIEDYAAARLFLERVSMDGVYLDTAGPDSRAVARICRALDGMPLAIEHAASCVRLYGLIETVHLVESGHVIDLRGRRTAPPRHRNLRAMLDHSHELLDETERAVFRRLAVFEGEFTVNAALAVISELAADAIRDCHAIGSLVAKSLLIRITHANGRSGYRFPSITRAYASGKLQHSGEAEIMYRQHASYVSKHDPGPDHTNAMASAPFLLAPLPELSRRETGELPECPREIGLGREAEDGRDLP
jgi:predicted ATPase/DNA-binding winged helix-turn-helix (wHTH) protein